MREHCWYCFFLSIARRAQETADKWDAERLPCLGSPWHKTCSEFTRLAEGEGGCRCKLKI
jgi:hypothetical protein